MVASINPYVFALLPAFVAAFVAGDDSAVGGHRRVPRAVMVSAAVSVGFAMTFVLVGVIFDSASGLFRQRMAWLTIAIGALMVLAGVAAIAGWKPRLSLRGLLVVSGGFAIWYGRHELRVYSGDLRRDSLVDIGTNLQTQFVVLIESIGAVRIGVAITAITLLAYLALRLHTRRLAVTTVNESDRKDPVISAAQEQHA